MTRLLILLLLAGCTSVSVKQADCDPPPIPAALLLPCEDAIIPVDASFAAIYSNAIENAVGPWGRCVRKDDKLIEVVKYRDAFCAKLKADAAAKSKPWWQFWE
jgi:hypothetical protein